MAGARWIVAVDADLERRLLAGEKPALQAWKQIGACARYFENQMEWREYRPYSQLAVVQDAASGGLLSGSILDLLLVLHKAALPLPAPRVNASSLRTARVVLNLDTDSLTARQKSDLEQFTRTGGVLVNPPAGWRFPAVAAEQESISTASEWWLRCGWISGAIRRASLVLRYRRDLRVWSPACRSVDPPYFSYRLDPR
jgi:hypothetical protein